ncbi:MAG: nucleoside recognition domain-containing protein [Eubacteriales bacterium]
MLGKVFGVISLISIVFGVMSGNTSALGAAVLDGAQSAVTLTLSLCGVLCLWCGVMNVLREAGAVKRLAALLSPVLRIFFPDVWKSGEGKEEIAAGIGANLLGIGNAATPLALSALKKLKKSHIKRGGAPEVASRDMITLAVMNTSSANLLPTTILALRRSAGASNPFSVVLPIWICSCCGALFALCLCRACGKVFGEKNGNG